MSKYKMTTLAATKLKLRGIGKMTINEISEKTLIPISLMVTIIGGVIWLATLWSRTEQNAENNYKNEVQIEGLAREVRQSNDQVKEELYKIRLEMERIRPMRVEHERNGK